MPLSSDAVDTAPQVQRLASAASHALGASITRLRASVRESRAQARARRPASKGHKRLRLPWRRGPSPDSAAPPPVDAAEQAALRGLQKQRELDIHGAIVAYEVCAARLCHMAHLCSCARPRKALHNGQARGALPAGSSQALAGQRGVFVMLVQAVVGLRVHSGHLRRGRQALQQDGHRFSRTGRVITTSMGSKSFTPLSLQ